MMQSLIEIAFDLALIVMIAKTVGLVLAVWAFGYMVRDLWR